jgi:prepilin-type N-terminal cleavage/methylation domain-containing protein
MAMASDEAGFTLVEVLVSAAILAVTIITAMSLLFVGRASSQELVEDVDATQQLRTALRQMADDLSFAGWDSRYPPTCYSTMYGDSFDGCVFAAKAFQPAADNTAAKWSAFPDFPGDLTSNSTVIGIRYLLQGDALIREVFDSTSTSRVYSSRTLVKGLIPYDGAGGGSEMTLQGTRRVRVVLQMVRPKGRGDRSVAKMSSEFFLADLR